MRRREFDTTASSEQHAHSGEGDVHRNHHRNRFGDIVDYGDNHNDGDSGLEEKEKSRSSSRLGMTVALSKMTQRQDTRVEVLRTAKAAVLRMTTVSR